MAAKKENPSYDFIVAHLKKDPKANYASVRDAAQKKKLKIFPIMFGRAQAQLGLVKSKPRKQKKAKAAGRKGAPARRGGKRSGRKAAAVDGTLESIVAAVKSSEQDKARFRGALERIQAILAEVLD